MKKQENKAIVDLYFWVQTYPQSTDHKLPPQDEVENVSFENMWRTHRFEERYYRDGDQSIEAFCNAIMEERRTISGVVNGYDNFSRGPMKRGDLLIDREREIMYILVDDGKLIRMPDGGKWKKVIPNPSM